MLNAAMNTDMMRKTIDQDMMNKPMEREQIVQVNDKQTPFEMCRGSRTYFKLSKLYKTYL